MSKLIHTCKPDVNGLSACGCSTYESPKQTWQEELIKEFMESEPMKRVLALEGTAIVTGRATQYTGITIQEVLKSFIESLLSNQKKEIVEGLKHIAMFDNGKEPKYLVQDVLDLINNLK